MRVGVLAAVHDELLPTQARLAAAPPRRDVQVITRVSGMGPQRMIEALGAMGDVDHVLLIGFAGGLADSAVGASVIRPRWVIDEFGHAIDLHSDMPRSADGATRDPRQTLLTLEKLAHATVAKRDLGRRHGAIIADMETFHVARVAAERRLPLTVLRAVSDSVDMSLPACIEQWVDGEGRARLWPAVRHLLTHPWQIGVLRRLERHAKIGAAAMASEAMRVIEAL